GQECDTSDRDFSFFPRFYLREPSSAKITGPREISVRRVALFDSPGISLSDSQHNSPRTPTMAQVRNAIGSPPTLQPNALSPLGGVALAAAAMAPPLGVILNAPAAAPAAGGALPLAFLVAFLVCLLVGNTVIRFARRLPSAGSFYAYNRHGLGGV